MHFYQDADLAIIMARADSFPFEPVDIGPVAMAGDVIILTRKRPDVDVFKGVLQMLNSSDSITYSAFAASAVIVGAILAAFNLVQSKKIDCQR